MSKSKFLLTGILIFLVSVMILFVVMQQNIFNPPQAKLVSDLQSYKIGIFQVVRHPVLDELAAQFQSTLKIAVPGEVSFTTMVPEGDAAKTEQMAQKFATEGYDLAFVIGTNLALSLAKKTADLPILLGAATDPQAAGLVNSWDHPGSNVTGTSDLSPVDKQITHLTELIPGAKRIGIIYNPSEENSGIIALRFKEACEKMLLTPITATITNQNEIRPTVVSLAGKIDALYAPTDATLQSAFPVLIGTANELKIPVFNCDEGTVKQGAVFSVGFDYAELGRISAQMAAEILTGKNSPSTMPIRMADEFLLFYNEKQIISQGLAVPESWKKVGKKVTE